MDSALPAQIQGAPGSVEKEMKLLKSGGEMTARKRKERIRCAKRPQSAKKRHYEREIGTKRDPFLASDVNLTKKRFWADAEKSATKGQL